jgi:hypothetical protein
MVEHSRYHVSDEASGTRSEVKDIRWIKKSELKKLVDTHPEQIFTLQLGVLNYYFNHAHLD